MSAVDANGFSGVRMLLTAAADSLDLSDVTLTGAVLVNAGSGNRSVTGSAGDDTIDGGQGDDVFLVG